MTDTPNKSPEKTKRPWVTRLARRVMFAAFMICAGMWVVSLVGFPRVAKSEWMQGVFLVLGLAVALQSCGRALPVQNVMMVTGIVVFFSSGTLLISGKTGIPFGPRTFGSSMGPQLFGLLPWSLPVIWVMAILNSRGVVRLILRPWRKMGNYGYWSIGLTVLLTVVFAFNLEALAAATGQWWIWGTTAGYLSWYTAPWTNFLGWTVTTVVILAFSTPWLINKNPRHHTRPDYRPLAAWLVINLIPAAACAVQRFWWGAAVAVVTSAIVTLQALRGARW